MFICQFLKIHQEGKGSCKSLKKLHWCFESRVHHAALRLESTIFCQINTPNASLPVSRKLVKENMVQKYVSGSRDAFVKQRKHSFFIEIAYVE